MGFMALFTSVLVVFTGRKLFLEVNQGHSMPTAMQNQQFATTQIINSFKFSTEADYIHFTVTVCKGQFPSLGPEIEFNGYYF